MAFASRTIISSLALSFFAIGALAAPTNEEIKIGITQEFENFNPLIGTMSATTYMSALSTRQMIVATPEGKWIPQLAKSIPSIENGQAKFVKKDGKKGLVVTWKIVDKAVWGDGAPLTCADFKFAWEVGMNENVSVPSRDGYKEISSITWDEKAPKKCVVTYPIAKWNFYRGMVTPLPKHIEQAVYDKFGKQKEGYDQNSEYTKNPTNAGLYNGPYVVSEMKLGSHVTFVANPKFYGPAPKIKKIIFKLIPNTGTLEANLRSGTIDMVSPLGFTFDQALAFEKKVLADKLPYQVLYEPGLVYEHIDLDLDNPILADLKVRKALLLAINRPEMVKALFEGKQAVAEHNISPKDVWYTKDPKKIAVYDYSKKDAAKLLEEAGWKLGADGYRYKNNKKLSLPFVTTAGNKIRENVQILLQSQWKAIGIEVILKTEQARVFFAETTRKRKFEGLAMYAWTSSPENSPRTTYASSMIPSEKNSYSGQNQSGWKNAKVDALLGQLDTTFDGKKRLEIAHQLLKEYTTDIPVIPLYYRSEVAVIPTNMTGYKITGSLFYDTYFAENWALK